MLSGFGLAAPVSLLHRDRSGTKHSNKSSNPPPDKSKPKPQPLKETNQLQRTHSAPCGDFSTSMLPTMDALPDITLPGSPPSPALPVQDIFARPKYSSSADLYHQTLLRHEFEPSKDSSEEDLYSLTSGLTTAQRHDRERTLESYHDQLDFGLSPTSTKFPSDYLTSSKTTLPDLDNIVDSPYLKVETPMSETLERLRGARLGDAPAMIARRISDHTKRDVVVAVIGAKGTGKSTFIQRCHDLPGMPAKGLSTKPYKVEDEPKYSIKLHEMETHKLVFGRSGAIIWAEDSNDHEKPAQVDAILMLYDVTNKSSTERVPEFLSQFCRANIPTLLVACKCDTPRARQEVDSETVEHLAETLGVEVLHTGSMGNGDMQKQCVNTLFWMMMAQKENRTRPAPGRRRANSTLTGKQARSQSPAFKKGHDRAISELSVSTIRQSQISTSELSNIAGGRTSRSKSVAVTGATSPEPASQINAAANLSGRPYNRDFSPAYRPSDEYGGEAYNLSSSSRRPQSLTLMPRSSDTSVSQVSISDMDSDLFSFSKSDASKKRQEDGMLPGERYAGIPWEDLVTRLLAVPMSKADSNFATVFFCFYRKFAAPRDLLKSILAAFDRSNEQHQSKLLRTHDQLRYCAVLYQWITNYPGDFCHPESRQNLRELADGLQKERLFAGVTKDILSILDSAIDDEDASWGRVDTDNHRNSLHSFMSQSTTDSHETGTVSDDSWDHCNPGASSADLHKDTKTKMRLNPADHAQLTSMHALTDPLHQFPHIIKEQYMFFMDIPEDNIVKELTRIDWSLFSLIKPRDFVRHVSVPASEKESDKSLEHINRLIRHFNQVAYWVAALVLERPKPKHRAKALEKFMNIAWLLRHHNNYNSLGAVIAGINGLALHRLTLTRSLVSEITQKRFMALEILMGTRKSHFSYRLAMDNTTGPCIPFIPLHRRDLVSADEGNRTFLVNNINWRKFEIMGEVLMVILRCQSIPYEETTPSTWTQKLILDASASVNDDELMEGIQDLYERSVQLEPGTQQIDAHRQGKRSWFGKR